MNNLVIAFIAIAVTQALQLLLTIVRERDIKRLRKLTAEQSMFIEGWLMAERSHSGQPGIIADHEPIAEDTRAEELAITRLSEPVMAPKDLAETMQPRTTEPAITRVSEPVITPKELPDTIPPRTIEEEAALVVRVIHGLNEAKSTQPKQTKPDGDQPIADVPAPAITPKGLPDQPALTEYEIKEMMGADRAREMFAVLHGTPPEKIG